MVTNGQSKIVNNDFQMLFGERQRAWQTLEQYRKKREKKSKRKKSSIQQN